MCLHQERADVRATAISLFGQLVMRSKETERALLKKEVVYSLLPLLLHLKDRETTVAMASSDACRGGRPFAPSLEG